MTSESVYIPVGTKAIIFDWDGTVVNSVGPKLRQNHALAHEFGNKIDLEQVRSHWNESSGFPDLLSRLTNGANLDDVMEVVRRDYAHPEYAKRRFDFAEVKIRQLRALGLRTALLTNATKEILNQDAYDLHLPLSELFDYIHTVEMSEYKKPDARVLTPTLQRLGLTASEVVYVGDEMKDYWLSVNAGARFIGVESGMSRADEFKKVGALYAPTIKEINIHANI